MTRVVLVLGYSSRRRRGADPICSARGRHARAVVRDGDVVVLSGTPDELDCMAAAWHDRTEAPRERDPATRTSESVLAAAALARRLGAGEVLVVTSWWHRPRAQLMLRLALRGSGVRVSGAGAPTPWSPFHLARELVCLPLVPLHLAQARRHVATA